MILQCFFIFCVREMYESPRVDQDYEKLAIFGTARQPFLFYLEGQGLERSKDITRH